MVKTAMNPIVSRPHMPGAQQNGYMLWETGSGDYTIIGYMTYPPYDSCLYLSKSTPGTFDPQQMAASASF